MLYVGLIAVLFRGSKLSNYDPLRLASGLDVLVDELERWTSATREVIHTADQTQRKAADQANRIMQKARLIANQAQQDIDLVDQTDTEVTRLEAVTKDTHQRAVDFIRLGNSALEAANQTYTYWKNELTKAHDWLKRAEARLAVAILALQQAMQRVSECEYIVQAAQGQLNDCRSQSGRNCSGPARALGEAKQQLIEAYAWLEVTKVEWAAAQQEVVEAMARVKGCEGAVGFSVQAVETASKSDTQVQEAKAQTDQSLSHTSAACKLWLKTQKTAEREKEIADDLIREASALEHTINETVVHLTNAIRSGENAQRYALDGRREVNYRADQLRLLNIRRIR